MKIVHFFKAQKENKIISILIMLGQTLNQKSLKKFS